MEHMVRVVILGTQFSKCFGIEIEKGYALDIQDGVIILFKDDLNLLLNQVNMVQVLFNYRNQFIRPIGGVQNVWAKKKKRAEIFQITSLDVVTRRNTKENPCLLNWKKYDECVMIQHFKTAGCRAPYHIKYKYISICSTKEEMEKASKNVFGLKMDAPCHEMPYIDFKYNFANGVFGRPDGYMLYFNYPLKAKFVTNSKDVDVHSLLGNVGGYIGLFLGKSHLTLSYLNESF